MDILLKNEIKILKNEMDVFIRVVIIEIYLL